MPFAMQGKMWNHSSLVLTIAAISFAIVQIISISALQENHGDPCSPSQPCNSSKWMECGENGTCVCFDEKWDFDPESGKCLTKVGVHCITDYGDDRDKNHRECAPLSQCSLTTRRCECLDPEAMYPNSKRSRCIPKGLYGQKCDKNKPCVDRDLFCIEEKCGCPEGFVYNEDSKKCLALIGTKCKQWILGWQLYASCVGNATCTIDERTCQCQPGFQPNHDNSSCLRSKYKGESCETSHDCFDELLCNEGVCGCELFELFQEKEYKSWFGNKARKVKERNVPAGTCTKTVGMICSEQQYEPGASNSTACPRNGYCDQSKNECVCKEGFTHTDDFGCGLKYGSPCDGKEVPGAGMNCDEGVVTCPSPDYQFYQDGCKSLVGGVCTEDPDEIDCVAGADCRTDNSTGDLRCHCKDGFVKNQDFSCDVAYGRECGYGGMTVCDRAAGLRCKDGKCGCKNKSDIYVEEKRKCLVDVGYPCKSKDDCVQNADCDFGGKSGVFGRCLLTNT